VSSSLSVHGCPSLGSLAETFGPGEATLKSVPVK